MNRRSFFATVLALLLGKPERIVDLRKPMRWVNYTFTYGGPTTEHVVFRDGMVVCGGTTEPWTLNGDPRKA